MSISGLPQGQENQGQEKTGLFEKESGILTKFEKISIDIVSSNIQSSLFSKAFKW